MARKLQKERRSSQSDVEDTLEDAADEVELLPAKIGNSVSNAGKKTKKKVSKIHSKNLEIEESKCFRQRKSRSALAASFEHPWTRS